MPDAVNSHILCILLIRPTLSILKPDPLSVLVSHVVI